MKPFLQNISQEYTESNTAMQLEIYIRDPWEFPLTFDTVRRVLKPLYELTSQAFNGTYRTWSTIWSNYGWRSLLYIRVSSSNGMATIVAEHNLWGVKIIQVDDIYGRETMDFISSEEVAVKRFRYNPIISLGELYAHFKGLYIRHEETGRILVDQREKIDKFRDETNQRNFRVRTRYHNISALTYVLTFLTRPMHWAREPADLPLRI